MQLHQPVKMRITVRINSIECKCDGFIRFSDNVPLDFDDDNIGKRQNEGTVILFR